MMYLPLRGGNQASYLRVYRGGGLGTIGTKLFAGRLTFDSGSCIFGLVLPQTRHSMSAPPKVRELVDHFRDNAEAYHKPEYNEAMVRQEFINPLFKSLGWDMDNEQGYAEAYKDVIHEAAIKIGGATKAPDYCFRIGGAPKFFLEAKRPSVSIKDDPAPAYQLRRYAWLGKLPLSVLTNSRSSPSTIAASTPPTPTRPASRASSTWATRIILSAGKK
jgi:hypothetical protein